jgi:tetratricopeptide (TPR) repeat protein
MTPSVPAMGPTDGRSSGRASSLERGVLLLLAFLALLYAFLAGLRAVFDTDLGWQMATGRWVAQHHAIPSVDVFSYTAQGQPWIYPVGAGLVFYIAYLVGGYTLISWIGALACVLAVALLMRRGSAVGAGIVILAVPLVALRTTPRADMFTVVLFAAFLSLLWENYQTGHAPLWLLPLLMVAWVNLHTGFVAGIGLVLAYVGAELLETLFLGERPVAVQRLRRASGWLLCAGIATLVNPWGWGIYRALIVQQRALGQQQALITEWSSVPMSWSAFSGAFSMRQTEGTIYLLLAVALVAAVIALLRAKLGAALWLLGAMYPAVRYVRMGALFACVVVVVGGWVLSGELARDWIRPARARSIVAWAAVVCLALLTSVRCFDLVTDRQFRGDSLTTFGVGLGWWFPQGAAEFIEREKLPGEIFNTYNEGGYFTWRLGPERQDYIDGRALPFGPALLRRHNQLLQESPDSALWQQEASRYHLNTILLPLGRFDVQLVPLQEFCSSRVWRPVYLDEISIILVRRTLETEELIQRFPVDCATAPLPVRPPAGSGAKTFNAWANAASVLVALGRNSEALAATENALSAFPGSAFPHRMRAKLLFAMGRLNDSEQDYLTAIAIEPSERNWEELAESYRERGRMADATTAMHHAADVSAKPYLVLLRLGYLHVRLGQADEALKTFDEASRRTPWGFKPADDPAFAFMLAQGRSGAWEAFGDLGKSTSYEEEAARLAPDAPEPWLRLAKLYARSGRVQDANRAKEHAAELEKH